MDAVGGYLAGSIVNTLAQQIPIVDGLKGKLVLAFFHNVGLGGCYRLQSSTAAHLVEIGLSTAAAQLGSHQEHVSIAYDDPVLMVLCLEIAAAVDLGGTGAIGKAEWRIFLDAIACVFTPVGITGIEAIDRGNSFVDNIND